MKKMIFLLLSSMMIHLVEAQHRQRWQHYQPVYRGNYYNNYQQNTFYAPHRPTTFQIIGGIAVRILTPQCYVQRPYREWGIVRCDRWGRPCYGLRNIPMYQW